MNLQERVERAVLQSVDDGVNASNREISVRFDFRGSNLLFFQSGKYPLPMRALSTVKFPPTIIPSALPSLMVIIVSSLEGKDIADAATELGRKWGVGGQKNNNGVVLMVSYGDRKLNISPGYGLENVLPDITCQQIIVRVIKPNFKGQDYYRGLDEGTDAIIQAAKGEFTAPAGYYKGKGLSRGKVFMAIIIVIILGYRLNVE